MQQKPMRFIIISTLIAISIVFLTVSCGGGKQVSLDDTEATHPSDFLQVGDDLFQNGDYENAFRAYGVVYYSYPNSREYIDAALGLSKCYGELENYEKEFEILYNLLRENLIPSKVPEIYNAIAKFYERSAGISEQLTGEGDTDYETAIAYYDKSLKYPNSEDVNAKGFAQFKIGSLYERLDRLQDAMTAYKTTVQGYGESEWAIRAEESITQLEAKYQRRELYKQEGLLPENSGAGENISRPDSSVAMPPESAPAQVPDSTVTTPEPPPAEENAGGSNGEEQ